MADTFCLLRLSSGWLNDLAGRHGVVWLSSSAAATGAGAQARLATTRLAQTGSDVLRPAYWDAPHASLRANSRQVSRARPVAHPSQRRGAWRGAKAPFRIPSHTFAHLVVQNWVAGSEATTHGSISLRLCRVPTSPVVLGVFGGALTSPLVFCDFIHFLLTLSNLEPFMQR